MKPCPLCEAQLQDHQTTCHKCGFTFISEPERKVSFPKKQSSQANAPCPFCKETIKADAVKCKHCGSIVQKQAALSPFGQIMAVAFGGFALLAIFLTFTSGNGQTNKPAPKPSTTPPVIDAAATQHREEQRTENAAIVNAQICAKEGVKNLLVSPGSADFDEWSQYLPVEKMADNTYIVNGYVDSQNRMGALIRSNWICRVRLGIVCNAECELFE